jgi:hypothetical protein
MKTSAEYLVIAQRCRIAKLSASDAVARDYLETFERNYYVLSKSAQMLARLKASLLYLKRASDPGRSRSPERQNRLQQS